MKIVLVMFKNGERRDFPITSPHTVIGRKQESGLRIPTRDVSRQHCEVVLDKVGPIVRDLGSSNGTYVNGKRVAESPLAPGDTLSIGPVHFIVQINGQPARITPHDARKPETAKPVEPPKPAAPEKKGEDLPPGLMPDDNEDSDILSLDDLDLDLADDDDETKMRKR
jgi:adenylate cyclase